MSDTIPAISLLVSRFKADEPRLCAASSGYTETEVRIEYIDPLFSSLGWDMSNSAGLPNSLKDVPREESQQTETSSKRPDYTFRIAAVRKFFVEAKKPAVDIKTNKGSAFQVRSYGWTARLPISVLTNFKTLRVYDTHTAPNENDDPDVGLLLEVDFLDLPLRFDELLSIFSREAVAAGSIEKRFGTATTPGLPIDAVFLERFNSWRLRLAQDFHTRYPILDLATINDLAQKIINRIVFIRMCEDRGIEGEERLRKVAKKKNLVELRKLFKELDDRYNTGLFDNAIDPLQTHYGISSQLFLDIVEELYFPKAPYSFSVLDADFLGQVYELFLAKRLALNSSGNIILQDKPAYEGREIIATPQPLVGEIVRRTFSGRLSEMKKAGPVSFDDLKELRVLDIAAGSGRFLLRSLDELVDAAIDAFRTTGDTTHIYRRTENDYRLSFQAKKELLRLCLFGIDIDFNAVEVARFSLLVKLLEDENRATLPTGKKILPNLDSNIVWGNSVVGEDFSHPDPSVLELTRPLDWDAARLPSECDAVVGNPPYVKTEEMKSKTPDEFAYYKRIYTTPYKQFDKYFVFIEKVISKLKTGAWLGMVVPNKWMTIEAGHNLRAMLASRRLVAEVVDFGNELLFEGKSNYVCLLILSNVEKEAFWYRHVNDYTAWLANPAAKGVSLSTSLLTRFGASSWILPANDAEAKVLSTLYLNSVRLGVIADVANGIQTSAEDVFSISSWNEHGNWLRFNKGDTTWEVEMEITKPYLMDSESRVKSYLHVEADARLIFPYEYGELGEAILIPPARMKREFPLTWNYLKYYKDRLSQRDISPEPGTGEFYCYGRHQALASAFKRPKIIYSVNQLGDKYGLDETGVGFASGGTAGEVAIGVPTGGYALEFILALLNQRVVEYFMRKRGSSFRGGYYSRGSAVVSDLPVPILDFSDSNHVGIHDQIVKLVRQIVGIQNSYSQAAGRQKERLATQRTSILKQIKEQFDKIWDFGGKDEDLELPGT